MRFMDIKFSDIPLAIGVLTRLPVFRDGPLAQAAWAFPIVGVVTGAAQALVAILALWAGLGPLVAAILAVATGVIITGALHEDGFADLADSFGAWTVERRLEIMRDSVIGSYGTLALIFSVLLRVSALFTLFAHDAVIGAVIGAAVISRAMIPCVMCALPHARRDGMSHRAGRPDGKLVILGLGLAFVIGLIGLGPNVIPVMIAAAAACAGVARYAHRALGGQTGDVLGAVQQASEIAALLMMIALIC